MMKQTIFTVSILLTMSACTMTEFVTFKTGITVACEIADVVLTHSDSDKIKRAVGDESFVKSVCDIFAPDAAAVDVAGINDKQLVTVELSTGEEVTALLIPN